MRRWLVGIFSVFVLLLVIISAVYYKSEIPAERAIELYRLEDSKFIEVDGLMTHYRMTGEGPFLVLVHGFGANLRNWLDWHRLLEDDFTVVSLDLPGFGLTGYDAEYDLRDSSQVLFLDRFLTQLGIDTCHLAGNSMGGAIAWKYSVIYPDKVDKLVLVNAAGYSDRRDDEENVIGFSVLRLPIINRLSTRITPRYLVKQSLEEVYADPSQVTEAEVDVYLGLMRRKGNRQALVQRMTMLHPDESSRIPEIRSPTLIIWGDKDYVIPVRHAYRFAEDIPNNNLLIYENIGHIPMVEIPGKSARDVAEYLKFQKD